MSDLVSLIILNYNGNNYTLDCLNSLRKQTYNNFEIILVDNGSEQSSYLELKNEIKQFESDLKITLIRLRNNLFFTGGNNKGLKIAQGDYFCLLNNDTEVMPDFIEKMVDFLKSRANVGMISPKIKVYNNKNFIWFAGADINFKTSKISKLRGIWDFDPDNTKFNTIEITDYAAGTALFLKREVMDKIGLLDEIFFMYSEETDWNLRAKRAGYKNYYVPTTTIYHKITRNVKKKPSLLKQFFMNRNSQILIWKHAGFFNLFVFYLKFGVKNLRIILKTIIKKEFYPAFLQYCSLLQGFKIGFKRRSNRSCRKYLLKDYYFIKRVENRIKSLR